MPIQGVDVSVTESIGNHLNTNLASFGRSNLGWIKNLRLSGFFSKSAAKNIIAFFLFTHLNLSNIQRLLCLPGYSSQATNHFATGGSKRLDQRHLQIKEPKKISSLLKSINHPSLFLICTKVFAEAKKNYFLLFL